MFTELTDIVPSLFAWLNQGPLTLTLFLLSKFLSGKISNLYVQH